MCLAVLQSPDMKRRHGTSYKSPLNAHPCPVLLRPRHFSERGGDVTVAKS